MFFDSKTAKAIEVGDLLIPDSTWNRTERVRKLLVPTKVLGVQVSPCQTGILLHVRFKDGSTANLSAGWFHVPGTEPKD